MLAAQWKYHDPGNTYWATVEECFTLMTVGRVNRGVPTRTLTDDDVAHSEHERSLEMQVVEATKRSMDGIRAPPATYDDLHNCFGWLPPGHDSTTVYDSSPTKTIRSMSHERTDTNLPPEASSLPPIVESSLSTVDFVPIPGSIENGYHSEVGGSPHLATRQSLVTVGRMLHARPAIQNSAQAIAAVHLIPLVLRKRAKRSERSARGAGYQENGHASSVVHCRLQN